MVIAGPLARMLDAESCIMNGVFREWGDVRENGKDQLVWEFENCGSWLVRTRSKELMEEFLLRLVWCMGDPKDFETIASRRSLWVPYGGMVMDAGACLQ